jgi:ACS family sodium-dependent inorganic phosphate cotransporter
MSNQAEELHSGRTRSKGWPKRVNLVILFFASNLICYMDRINIAITAPVIMKEFGWDEAVLGIILSSFFCGYTLLQIPGGWLADRYGGKKILGAGVLWWSFFTMITPFARTVTNMIIVRTLMGLGEGVNFPSIQSITSRWIPSQERSRVMGFTLSGISVGNILAFPLATWIMTVLGWQYVFFIFGLLGFIWCAFWIRLAANRPEEHKTIHSHELEYITAHRPEIPPVVNTPWKLIVSKVQVWALVINHFCVSWGFFMFLTWLPTYLVKAHNFSIKEMGIYSMFPYLAMVIGSNGSGWLADYCIKHTGNITLIRKVFHTVSLFSASVFLILLAQAETKPLVIILVTLALGMMSMTGSTTGPNAMDIGPRYAGIIMGMQTTAGNIAGVIVPLLVGFIVSFSNRWDLIFYIAAGVLMFGAIIWNIFATGRQILE